jgi:signal transduction histidine kinase
MRVRPTLAAKFLLVVAGGALLPLLVTGVWLTQSTRTSGEELLRSRLDAGLLRAAREAGTKWVARRSALLDIRDDTVVRRVLMTTSRVHLPGPTLLPGLRRAMSVLRDNVQTILLADSSGGARALLAADATGRAILLPAPDSSFSRAAENVNALPVRIPVSDGGRLLGWVEARLRSEALMPSPVASVQAAGAIFGVIDRRTGVAIVPLPFDPALLQHERFVWGRDEWLIARRPLEEPAIELLAAAPLSGFTLPFERARRTGLIGLALVALLSFMLTGILTRHTTRSLVTLTAGAEAVAAGDLTRTVRVQSHDEVGRLARAFNAMTESLRHTLDQLSERQAVAAVGEFAASLAHEIRNPLSAIRLNLQHTQEQLGDDERAKPIGNALRDIARLEQTLNGALRMARTGQMHMVRVNVADALQAAIRSARPEFEKRGVAFVDATESFGTLDGNSAALEQLFLNLLLNAAQACQPGDRAGIRSTLQQNQLVVTIWDSGSGFDANALNRAFEPFFSTKPEGSGLGLNVARRIAASHGGSIDIETNPSSGTQLHVRLPISNALTHAL